MEDSTAVRSAGFIPGPLSCPTASGLAPPEARPITATASAALAICGERASRSIDESDSTVVSITSLFSPMAAPTRTAYRADTKPSRVNRLSTRPNCSIPMFSVRFSRNGIKPTKGASVKARTSA
ncbi:hypothetical protein D3C71_1786970 [compost metagenome]